MRLPRRAAFASAFVIAVLAMAPAHAQNAAEAEAALPPVAVQAPHHGDVLFHVFQGRSFSALSSLMVSQHFARLAPHDDEAEVLRGGLLLSWGLHEEAREVFVRLIERQAPPRVRDRAWFFLARLQHQRGLLAEAEASLARIGAPLAGALEDEHQLLRAQLRLAQGDAAGAAAVLEALADPKAPRQPAPAALMLARFNLAVALLRLGGGQPEAEATLRGTALLEQVGATPSADEEQRAIRDRANVALGFAALQSSKPREARMALQRVRLDGAMSNKALLGHGWAAASLNDPQLALVAWTELAGRDLGDAAVLEAQIAVPYAMAEIGAYAQALDRYRQAVAQFEREQRALDDSIAAIRAGALLQGLDASNPDDENAADAGLAAFARIDRLPSMPHGAHLRPLLADHPFQETWKQLRDLRFMAAHLGRWQANLGTYGAMLDERRAAFAERLPRVREAAGATALPALEQRRAALAAELAEAEARGDGVALADAGEQALLQRLQRARAALAAAAAASEPAPAAEAGLTSEQQALLAERLKRVEGALTWQLAQRAAERSWDVKKGLRDSARALEEARTRDAALLRAQAEEPARHERFATRIATLAERIRALQPQVVALQAEAGERLAVLAVAELQGQQERLRVYAAQARLAIAQILDRAQLAQRSEPPAAGGLR
jgi:hypothetical protein